MTLADALLWLVKTAATIIGGILLGLVALALILLPMLCSNDVYDRLVPFERRTKYGPHWCYLILQIIGLCAAVTLIDCVP